MRIFSLRRVGRRYQWTNCIKLFCFPSIKKSHYSKRVIVYTKSVSQTRNERVEPHQVRLNYTKPSNPKQYGNPESSEHLLAFGLPEILNKNSARLRRVHSLLPENFHKIWCGIVKSIGCFRKRIFRKKKLKIYRG